LEFPLLLVRKRENDGTRGYAGMAREKPVELADVSDDAWKAFRDKVNSIVFTCPFSYGRTFAFVILWLCIVLTGVILTFGAIGPSSYFWEAFWKCQSKHHPTPYSGEVYSQDFCTKYSGWGSACMLSFFIVFSAGLFGFAYRESRKIKRWRREVEPEIKAISKEHSQLFERYGYFLEMRGWKIVFRHIASDGTGVYSFDTHSDVPTEVSIPSVPTQPEAAPIEPV
jgi:hypothetical protein